MQPSDYADSHKNDAWQRYASAIAAAVAKELLSWVPLAEVCRTIQAREVLERTSNAVDHIEKFLESANTNETEKKVNEFLQALYTSPYLERKNRNVKHVQGTCSWFTNHKNFKEWQDQPSSGILWVSADPGCGKSVLSRYLVDEVLPGSSKTVCYFFFKDDFADQRVYADALCALLHQIFSQQPALLDKTILDIFTSQRSIFTQTASVLWDTLLTAAENPNASEIICILDALDECQGKDRRELVRALSKFGFNLSPSSKLKFLVTSRPYQDISHEFSELERRFPTIRLKGENEEELAQISNEIDMVIHYEINQISANQHLQPAERQFLCKHLTGMPNRTYLWAHLVLDDLKASLSAGVDQMRHTLSHLPQTVDGVYEKIFKQIPNRKLAEKLFSIVIGSFRPLTVKEIILCLYTTGDEESYDDLSVHIASEESMRTSIRDLSGLLVNIIDSKVYLIHQTAKEFLIEQTISGNDQARPSNISGTDSPPSCSPQHTDRKWKHSLCLSSIHATLIQICICYLDLKPGKPSSSELEQYGITSLFAHIYLAESQLSQNLARSAIRLLDETL